MPTVRLDIHQHNYSIACGDGQEEHLMQLAERLNDRIETLHQTLPSANHSTLLLMAGLMLEDELLETKTRSDSAQELEEVVEQCAQKLEQLASELGNV